MSSVDKKFRFREFQVYKDALLFQRALKRISRRKFPREEAFNLTSQLWRALDSIILNIAEGSARSTDKDFAHFLNTANASLNEVVACLDLALNDSYFTKGEHQQYLELAEKLANQITAFRRKILLDSKK